MEMDFEKLSKYFSGEMTFKEKEEFLSGLTEDTAQLDEFSRLKNIWTLTRVQSQNSFNKKMVKKEWRFFNRNTIHKGKKHMWRRAAILALVIGVGVASYFLGRQPIEGLPTAYTTLSVPAGQYAQATLPDGSEIWLNSRSTLIYSDKFTSGKREVHLEGEGFFKVVSDKKHPFIVKTKDMDITATGTQFNVSAYKNDQWTSATLIEGIINLYSESNNISYLLKEGQSAVYNKMLNNISLKTSDIDEISWIKGEFCFKEMSLEDIAKRLERNFNVAFVFDDSGLKDKRFTGTFYNHQSVENILKALKTSTKQMFYWIENDTVYIRNK